MYGTAQSPKRHQIYFINFVIFEKHEPVISLQTPHDSENLMALTVKEVVGLRCTSRRVWRSNFLGIINDIRKYNADRLYRLSYNSESIGLSVT